MRIRYFREATDEYLHLLRAENRIKGYGTELVRQSVRPMRDCPREDNLSAGS